MYSTTECNIKSIVDGDSTTRNKICDKMDGSALAAHSISSSEGDTEKDSSIIDASDSKNNNLRRGKWTQEEENYTNKVIEAFNNGLMRLPEKDRGITLRAYLAEQLSCDPMRITKKYTGSSCLGKRVYHAHREGVREQDINRTAMELQFLEAAFRQKLLELSRKKNSSNCPQQQFNQMVSTPAIDALMKQGSVAAGGVWANKHDMNNYSYPMSHSQGQYPAAHNHMHHPGMFPPPSYNYAAAMPMQGGLPAGAYHLPPGYSLPGAHGMLYSMHSTNLYHLAKHGQNDSYDTTTQQPNEVSNKSVASKEIKSEDSTSSNRTEPSAAPLATFGYLPTGLPGSFYGAMPPPYANYGTHHYPMQQPPSAALHGKAAVLAGDCISSAESHSGADDAKTEERERKRSRSNSQQESLKSTSTPYLTTIPGVPALQCPPEAADSNTAFVRPPMLQSSHRNASSVPVEDADRLKTCSRDGDSGEAASSLLGFFNKLEKNNSQQDLVEFFEGVQKSAVASSLSPTNTNKTAAK